jgi:hypothetical protein
LVICGNLLPVIVKTRPAWHRLRYRLGRLVPFRQPTVPVLADVEEPVSVPGVTDTLELPELAASASSVVFPYAGSMERR